ncbi:MAG: efflux transporter outer membrane subunit [Rhodoferax sp.]|uniref:efflux transporter outer membrane subunit n=1 Tax=Rhodoferax sp. TaxID=50421 RepID=UPI003263AE8B
MRVGFGPDWRLAGSGALCAALLGGCATSPVYQKPALDMPVAWKVEAPWRISTPEDAAAKGPWWLRFGDTQLNALEQQASSNSPTLALASARLAQARANLDASSASAFPQLALGARAARQRISANRPLTNYNSQNFSTLQNDFVPSLSASYELDLAGRVSSSIASARASAEQAGADFENIRLLQSADLATNYFNLRALDVELDVLQRSIALQNRALELVSSRHELGAATGLDVAQQQALLDTTLVQVDVLRRQRGQFEHAIATLAGIPAPLFSLAPDARALTPPAVPLGLPSDLLERRPDIASAERAMAAANAQIGVANAAFYPSIILGSALGAESNRLSTLFDAPSLLWSLGLSATEVLFDGGRIKANLEVAKLGHTAAVANYRRVVLGAMQEVEDGITGLAALDRASAQARIAVNTASRVLDMATARYEGGASAYLDVITAQQSWLASERQASQLLGQRLVTSVFLVKALGGDWQPVPQTVSKNQP